MHTLYFGYKCGILYKKVIIHYIPDDTVSIAKTKYNSGNISLAVVKGGFP